MSTTTLLREVKKRNFLSYIWSKTNFPFELEYRFAAPERKWRSDVAWVNLHVALEIDGGTWVSGRHNRPSSALAEMDKNNGYAERGWLVFHSPWKWLEDMSFADRIINTLKARNEQWKQLNRRQSQNI